jgi:hypothetical protein
MGNTVYGRGREKRRKVNDDTRTRRWFMKMIVRGTNILRFKIPL